MTKSNFTKFVETTNHFIYDTSHKIIQSSAKKSPKNFPKVTFQSVCGKRKKNKWTMAHLCSKE